MERHCRTKCSIKLPCTICPEAFQTRRQLNGHVKGHQAGEGHPQPLLDGVVDETPLVDNGDNPPLHLDGGDGRLPGPDVAGDQLPHLAGVPPVDGAVDPPLHPLDVDQQPGDGHDGNQPGIMDDIVTDHLLITDMNLSSVENPPPLEELDLSMELDLLDTDLGSFFRK